MIFSCRSLFHNFGDRFDGMGECRGCHLVDPFCHDDFNQISVDATMPVKTESLWARHATHKLS